MARTLPSAKRGGGRLQHSSKAPVDAPAGREMTPAERATAAVNLSEAYARAGRETPEQRAAYTQAVQAHVPRMVEWYNRNERAGKLTGHTDDKPLKTGLKPGDVGYDSSTHQRTSH